jgi:hypothetical protein
VSLLKSINTFLDQPSPSKHLRGLDFNRLFDQFGIGAAFVTASNDAISSLCAQRAKLLISESGGSPLMSVLGGAAAKALADAIGLPFLKILLGIADSTHIKLNLLIRRPFETGLKKAAHYIGMKPRGEQDREIRSFQLNLAIDHLDVALASRLNEYERFYVRLIQALIAKEMNSQTFMAGFVSEYCSSIDRAISEGEATYIAAEVDFLDMRNLCDIKACKTLDEQLAGYLSHLSIRKCDFPSAPPPRLQLDEAEISDYLRQRAVLRDRRSFCTWRRTSKNGCHCRFSDGVDVVVGHIQDDLYSMIHSAEAQIEDANQKSLRAAKRLHELKAFQRFLSIAAWS